MKGNVINSNPSVICDQQFISLHFLAEEVEVHARYGHYFVMAKQFYQLDHHAPKLPWNHSQVGVGVLVDRKRPGGGTRGRMSPRLESVGYLVSDGLQSCIG